MQCRRYLKWDYLVLIYVKLRIQTFLWKKMAVWSKSNLTIISMGQREYFAEGSHAVSENLQKSEELNAMVSEGWEQMLLTSNCIDSSLCQSWVHAGNFYTVGGGEQTNNTFSQFPFFLQIAIINDVNKHEVALKFVIQIWTIMKNIDACFPSMKAPSN